MSTTRSAITVTCDRCHKALPTTRTTSAGARGDAERAGWRTSHIGDGYHESRPSADPGRRDLCPDCRPDNNTVGTVRGKLQLVIGEADPIPLTTIALPIRILNGTNYNTYSLRIDLAEVTDTIQAIFTAAEADHA